MEVTKNKNLEFQRKRAADIRTALDALRVDGQLPRGVMQKVAAEFGVTRAAVSQIASGKRHAESE